MHKHSNKAIIVRLHAFGVDMCWLMLVLQLDEVGSCWLVWFGWSAKDLQKRMGLCLCQAAPQAASWIMLAVFSFDCCRMLSYVVVPGSAMLNYSGMSWHGIVNSGCRWLSSLVSLYTCLVPICSNAYEYNARLTVERTSLISRYRTFIVSTHYNQTCGERNKVAFGGFGLKMS